MNKIVFLLLTIIASQNAFAECAIANDKNSYGTACSSLNRKDAEDQAIVRCGQSGGRECRVMAHFEKGCWAIAKDRGLEISAYAYGKATLEQAKSESISACLSHGGKTCVNTPNVGCEETTQFDSAQPSSTKSQEAPVSVTSTSSTINCDRIDGWWSRMQCQSKQSKKREEQAKLDAYRSKCTGLGFQPGTNEFAKCTLQLLTQDNANYQAEQQRQVERLKPPPMVDLTPGVVGPSNRIQK